MWGLEYRSLALFDVLFIGLKDTLCPILEAEFMLKLKRNG